MKATSLHEKEGEGLDAGANLCLPPLQGPAGFTAIPDF